MRANQGGFTLIELIIVIVILGALAVVAVPRYVDLQSQAEQASAEGVYGAAQAAAAINFSAGLAGVTGAQLPAGGEIDTGQDLLDAMDGTPDGWIDSGQNVCWDTNGDSSCSSGEYRIVVTAETDTAKAGLSFGTVP